MRPGRRTVFVQVTLATVLALAIGTAWVWRSTPNSQPLSVPAVVKPTATADALRQDRIAGAVAPAQPGSSPPSATRSLAEAAHSRARADLGARTHWELCGIGRLPVPQGAPPDAPPPHIMLEAATSLVPRWEAALATAGPRTLAAARRAGLMGVPAGEAAVTLAMTEGSPDPVISAWATQACGNDGACLDASSRRWQQLEPDNLAPRLWALRGTQKLDLTALQALAQARRYHVHFGQLGASMLAAWPAGEAPFLQTEMLIRTIGIDAAAALPALLPLSRSCREGSAQADIRDACQRIARTMLQHSDSLMGVGIGMGLGRAAGLPVAELEAARAMVHEAYQANETLDGHMADQPWSCTSNTQLVEWVGEVQQYGEWRALQRRLAARAQLRR